MTDIEDIALIDMDNTLCDYVLQLSEDLEMLKSPKEPPVSDVFRKDAPMYMRARMKLIKSSKRWWAHLPRYQPGWDVLEVIQELNYKIMILTQSPRNNPAALAGKQEWITRELGPDVDVTLTRDKGLVYGKVLVDDYPVYAERWLKHRHNGLVIMPENEFNTEFSHPNVIHYNGSNLNQVRDALEIAKVRRAGEDLAL